jgi:large subunit ribosomal protein L9
MQVVLLERIEKLGQMGEVVTVRDGFARNYLLPQRKALRATRENLARFETQRTELEARNREARAQAEQNAGGLDGQSFAVLRQAGEAGQLYGSVSARDIARLLTENGFAVARGQIALDEPIKALGLHPVRVYLHPEVPVTVTINVARSEAEAERQAAGLSGAAEPDEEEAEALFADLEAEEDGETGAAQAEPDEGDQDEGEDEED